jgi:4-hydroxy-2-oxovalerate aldolase
MKNKVEILDTTLRDGSYTIGYQFSLQDNVIISSGLEKAGVNLIEIGHGAGLGSSRIDSNAQAYSDKQYMQSVSDTLTASKFGFFFIPGIGNSDDIQMLSDHGGGFIRIGVSIENYSSAKKYIALAKKLNIKFWVNLMKSYVYSFEEFAEFSKICFHDGADGLYLVDSAGGMLPSDVSKYIQAANVCLDKSNASNFHLGFHGHENISMGVACALSAVQSGASIVDGSLLGIGRSMGNSPIETLGIVLQKAGYSLTIDPWKLSDLAEKTIKPYLENRWRHSSIEQALGFKEIHSNFLKDITKFAHQEKINLRDLILALPDDARKSVNTDMLLTASKNSCPPPAQDQQKILLDPKNKLAKELSLSLVSKNEYLINLLSLAERTNGKSVLLLTPNWNKQLDTPFSIKKIKSVQGFEIGALDLSRNLDEINLDIKLIQQIDYLIYDAEFLPNKALTQLIQRIDGSKVFRYSDKNIVMNHIGRHLSVIASNKLEHEATVYIFSEDNLKHSLISSIEDLGFKCLNNPDDATFHVLLSLSDGCSYQINNYKELKFVIDVRSHILNYSDVEFANANNINLVAIDFESAIIAEVIAIVRNYENLSIHAGDLFIEELRLVAKGRWGNNGDIVVDKVPVPTCVLGISDGLGGLKLDHSNQDNVNINKIVSYIINQ